MLDMYMWLCPISFQYMQHPKQSHLHVFLDPADCDQGMQYYTPEEVLAGTETQVKEMMRKVLEGQHTAGQRDLPEDPSSSNSEHPTSGKKRKFSQARLPFGGDRDGGGAAVMSVIQENVPTATEAADSAKMDEMVCDQFDTYKRVASKTLNASSAPATSVGELCSVTDPDQWWSRQGSRFPLVHAVWQHVSSLVLSSGQIERILD